MLKDYSLNSCLKTIDQHKVWQEILCSSKIRNNKFTSPFRKDSNPGCFLREYNNILFFTDNADSQKNHFTCVHAYSYIKNISLSKAIIELSDNVLSEAKVIPFNIATTRKSNLDYSFTTTTSKEGIMYWKKRNISIYELCSDQCKAVEVDTITNQYGTFCPPKPCFAYLFEDNKIKFYCPFSEKSKRFFGNISSEHYWSWAKNSSIAIITKSFKDGFLISRIVSHSVYAFQNEGVKPSILNTISSKYKKVIIIYDNDKPGIEKAEELKEFLLPKIETYTYFFPIHVGKDADDIFLKSPQLLTYLLKKKWQ